MWESINGRGSRRYTPIFNLTRKKQQCTAFRQQNDYFLCQRRAQVASSMKIVLYEVVTWTWQKYFGSISLSLHTKKADQRAMSDSRVQREITLFQMTFEWKRASRVVAVVPVSSFIDFCPEIQDGRVGWTTNSTKTKQIFGLRSHVREVFPTDKRGCHHGTDGGRQPTPACCLNWK